MFSTPIVVMPMNPHAISALPNLHMEVDDSFKFKAILRSTMVACGLMPTSSSKIKEGDLIASNGSFLDCTLKDLVASSVGKGQTTKGGLLKSSKEILHIVPKNLKES